MQKTQWRSRTSCWKFWWLDNSRSQGPKWQLRISKQSPICSRGAGLGWPLNGSSRIRPKQKLHKKPREACKSSWSPIGSLKSFYTDNSLEFGKACDDLSWNHCTSTPHRSRTNGIAERAVCRVKEGTSAVLLQPGLNESWWADSMECYTYLRNVTDLLSDGKTPYERRFGQPFKEPIIPFGSLVEYHPITAMDQSRIRQFGKKVLPGMFLGYAFYAGRIWEGWRTGCRPWGVGNDGRIRNLLKKTQCERGDISQRRRIYFSNRRWTNQTPWRKSRPENILLDTTATNSRRKSPWFSWRIRRFSSTTSRLTSGFRWSDKWFLVHVRKLHIPPSRWTQSQTLLAERGIIPYSTEVHWRFQNCSYEFGCQAGENASMIIGISMDQETCLVHGQVSLDLFY